MLLEAEEAADQFEGRLRKVRHAGELRKRSSGEVRMASR